MLVNSCISEEDRIGMKGSRKSCAQRGAGGGEGMQLTSSEEQ